MKILNTVTDVIQAITGRQYTFYFIVGFFGKLFTNKENQVRGLASTWKEYYNVEIIYNKLSTEFLFTLKEGVETTVKDHKSTPTSVTISEEEISEALGGTGLDFKHVATTTTRNRGKRHKVYKSRVVEGRDRYYNYDGNEIDEFGFLLAVQATANIIDEHHNNQRERELDIREDRLDYDERELNRDERDFEKREEDVNHLERAQDLADVASDNNTILDENELDSDRNKHIPEAIDVEEPVPEPEDEEEVVEVYSEPEPEPEPEPEAQSDTSDED